MRTRNIFLLLVLFVAATFAMAQVTGGGGTTTGGTSGGTGNAAGGANTGQGNASGGPGATGPRPVACIWVDDQLVGCGPIEFARVMAGARAVVTNFFHGCVFSLLHHKPWVCCTSDYRALKIPDLVKTVGARPRLIDSETPAQTVDELLGTPVEAVVAARLEELRDCRLLRVG